MPKTVDDPFYRYKRATIESTYIKKNGGSTIISVCNLNNISKDLDRSIDYLIQFLKKNLKTRITKINNDYHIKGLFDNNYLDNIIEKCVVYDVLCNKCTNPETYLLEGKKICKSCGYTENI